MVECSVWFRVECSVWVRVRVRVECSVWFAAKFNMPKRHYWIPRLLLLKPGLGCDGISVAAEFMVDVAAVEARQCVIQ